MNAWMGKILRVNLTTKSYGAEDLDPAVVEMYLGGHGVATKILMDEMDPKVAPLSPDNKFIFSSGPLTGSGAVLAGRYMVTSKSPLTGLIGFANSGGFFGPAMKATGYDHVIIEGSSDKPVYLWIDDDKVEIREADHLWGMNSHDTEDQIRKEVEGSGKRARIACIGPAGERLVRFAAVMNDKHRAAARCGLGAVMGSKKLKAVAVRGSKKVEVADPEGLKKAIQAARENLKANPMTAEVWPNIGTPATVKVSNELGILPTRNFQRTAFGEGAVKISGETLAKTFLKKKKACAACPIGCGRGTEVNEQGFEGEGEGPEYETIAMLGSNLGIDNLAAVTKANYICNELGIDTISAGGTIACAMEMYERGYLTKEDTGIELKFGDGELLVKLITMMGNREGFGDVLAEGGYLLAEKYGHPEVFMGVNKMEMPGYDPRGAKGMGITYMTSTIGPSHCRGYTLSMEAFGNPQKIDPIEEKGKGGASKMMQDMTSAWDSAGLCLFGSLGLEPGDALAMLTAATGQPFDMVRFVTIGERIFNLQRLFNLKAGLKGEDERLPDRFYQEALPDGISAGTKLGLKEAMSEYYTLREWEEKSRGPSQAKLEALGLSAYALK